MNISAKIEYGCLAVLELAMRYEETDPTPIRSIAKKHGVPSRFLVQILLQLKAAGLVASTRGAAGGYRLAKSPEQITLCDVMSAIDGASAELQSNAAVDTSSSRTLLRAWNNIETVQQEMLQAITFAQLAKEARGEAENMYYI